MIRKILSLSLIALFFFFSGCQLEDIIARMEGSIGVEGNMGTEQQQFFTDTGFDRFSFNTQGEESSTQIILTFDNLAGEFMSFILSAQNEGGDDIDSMFGTGSYSINGSSNKFEGTVFLGNQGRTFSGSTGDCNIEIFTIQSNRVTQLKGAFDIKLNEGGSLNGWFQYQGNTQ